jgi:hypothetical protein
MPAAYDYTKAFHVRTISFAVFLAMAFYYAAIAFHWPYITAWLSSLSIPILGYALLLSFTVAMKGGMFLRIYSRQDRGTKARNAVLLVSFYLAVALTTVAAAVWVSQWLRTFLSTPYWQSARWFWTSSVLLVAFAILGYVLHSKKLISWNMLQDFKAIPIVSPVFCFGAPVVWANNLAYASLPKETLSIYSTLSISSGSLFLAYWVAYAVCNHRLAETKDKNSPVGLLGTDGKPLPAAAAPTEVPTWICLSIFATALYLFALLLVDVLIRLAPA